MVKKATTGSIRLSPSALAVFKNCPRCFWLQKRLKMKAYRGIMASLMGGMDRIIKVYMDGHRAAGTMPGELRSLKEKGIKLFPDQAKINAWRMWQTGLSVAVGSNSIFGGIDDVLVTSDGYMIPFDYKTKGSEADEAYCKKYYQHQLDMYGLMFQGRGYKVLGKGIFSYWSPKRVCSPVGGDGGTQFNVQSIMIDLKMQDTLNIFHSAIRCLEGRMPEPSKTCEMCTYQKERVGIENQAEGL